jgi:hypothetical protein
MFPAQPEIKIHTKVIDMQDIFMKIYVNKVETVTIAKQNNFSSMKMFL